MTSLRDKRNNPELNDEGGSTWVPYTRIFQEDVVDVTPSKKYDTVSGRILPGYSTQVSDVDSAFAASWEPYREQGSPENPGVGVDGTPTEMTRWAEKYYIHKMLNGDPKFSYISPREWRNTDIGQDPNATFDPSTEGFFHIKKLLKDDPKHPYGAYIKSQDDWQKDVFFTPADLRYYVNMYGPDPYVKEGEEAENINFIMSMAKSVYLALVDRLNAYRPAFMTAPRDPNFPAFVYGDITNPTTGVHVKMARLKTPGSNSTNPNTFPFHPCLFPGDNAFDDGSYDKCVVSPVDATVLENRYDLLSEKVISYTPPQLILDTMINLGAPVEVLKEICDSTDLVVNSNTQRMPPPVDADPATPAPPAPAAPAAESAPPPPPPPPPPPAPEQAAPPPPPPPAPPVEEEKFWVNTAAGVILVRHSELVDHDDALGCMPEDQSGGWKTVQFFRPAKDVAPAAPPPPAAPAAPPPPPPAAAEEPAPAAPLESASGLTDEEQKRMAELSEKAQTDSASKEEVEELLALMHKGS